ncbi:MAG: hypothetical protein COB02_15580 [Candidatus Cloacimonadota bacterium]|nr:MAG: hypothetical protein COB02_15580 [Candidatus Cloacimonadota bacterium]
MKLELLIYHFKELKLFSLLSIGFSILFFHFVIGHEPRNEVTGLVFFFFTISIILGIIQVQKDELSSDLILLHLPIEKSHLWIIRTFTGVISLIGIYCAITLLGIMNPSTMIIDLLILLTGISSYFIARVFSIFINDKTKVFFTSVALLSFILIVGQMISIQKSQYGLGFPIHISTYKVFFLVLTTSVSSYFLDIQNFRKSIS